MRKTKTSEFYDKIKSVLSPESFHKIENQINEESNFKLEAFWHIIVAGYSAEFAAKNYEKLYNFL